MNRTAYTSNAHGWIIWPLILLLVYALLVGVGVIGEGFKWISGGAEGAEEIFEFARNPIVGVILGVLATALVQSSSTVTSVVVGLVAGGVPVSIAIPIIMGANMGTTITNTIVSLGSIHDRKAFNKSFQAATVHDLFNFYSILIFLPIELMFRPLERLSGAMAGWFVGGGDASMKELNFMGAMTKPVSNEIVGVFEQLPDTAGAILTIVAGIAIVIFSVLRLGKLLRAVLTGTAKGMIDVAIGRGPLSGVASGTVTTILVQSSSTTTSLVVPLAGAGALTTRQVFPFTMGANIGTCITALLAATAVAGDNEVFALQIALVHLFYNVFGVVLFLYMPWLKDTPIWSAEWLGNKTEANRLWAVGYILGVFFVLPGVVLWSQQALIKPDEQIVSAAQSEQAISAEKAVHDSAMAIE